MKHIGLFEGIGGFSLASKTMGWETIAWCEINPFCHTVLNYHFPKATGHHDITKTDFTIYRGKCDIITGGFPCQPYSAAGKRLGTEDDRHLWPEMLRAIREIQPSWVVGENVRGLTNWNGGLVFDQVQADLENEGYQVTPFLLPACAVNAPHRRDRIWFIAYSDMRRGCREKGVGNNDLSGSKRKEQDNNIEQTDTGLADWTNSKPTSNTNNSGTGITMRNDGNGQTENQRWEGQSQFKSGQIGSVTADTTNTRIEGMRPERENEIHGSGIIADTNDEGLERGSRKRIQNFEGGSSRIFGSVPAGNNKPNYWQNFPTEPPVCSRNDGISTRLVGITFSKHRQESIKAYGNAVVPQVVLQIFKAIAKYNNLSE